MEHDHLPTCPDLRALAIEFNYFWANFDDENYTEKALAFAREVGPANARERLEYVFNLLQSDASVDQRARAFACALALMHVHGVCFESAVTGEAFGFCMDCGHVIVMRPVVN